MRLFPTQGGLATQPPDEPDGFSCGVCGEALANEEADCKSCEPERMLPMKCPLCADPCSHLFACEICEGMACMGCLTEISNGPNVEDEGISFCSQCDSINELQPVFRASETLGDAIQNAKLAIKNRKETKCTT